jgi:hypothetical protein
MLTVKIRILTGSDVSTGAKVNQLEVEGTKVHQQIFILDVTMDHPFSMASDDCLNNLAEKVASQLFIKHTLLRDVIKEILAGFGSLHDNDEGVMPLEAVDQFDHSGSTGHYVHQAYFQRYSFSAHLEPK